MSRFFYTDYIRFLVLFLYGKWLWTVERRRDRDNLALLVERHLVNADFAMDAWFVADEVLVDAVVNDVPFVLAGNLEHRVMSCAIDLILGLLLDNEVIVFINRDGAKGRLRRTVAYVVVG